MKKKIISLLLILAVLGLTACGKSTLDQTELYNKINTLAGDFSSDYISYETVLTAEDKKLALHNEGTLKNENGTYTYSYSYQHLNKIGSGADSLISTETGSISGSKEELLAQGFDLGEGTTFTALALKDSFKSYKITEENGSYVMTGYIARNTIIKFTEGLDDDIRFYYRLTVNSDCTEIEQLELSYATTNFDSVVITIIFKEAEK